VADRSRAERLLHQQLTDGDYHEKSPAVITNKQIVHESQPFTTFLMNGRNEIFGDPFDEFDPHHTISGKKAFNCNVRAK
jgi:hypothetical protein